MTESIIFSRVPDSALDLERLVPAKFSKVLWIEDLESGSKLLTIHGQLCEVSSTGLQLIGEGGSVKPHKEAYGVSEWIVPLWTLDPFVWGGQYEIEDSTIDLTKNLPINYLVGAHFALRINYFGEPELLILPYGPDNYISVFPAREMPAGKTHQAIARDQCLYFVFKTKPIGSDYHAEPSM